MSSVALRRPRQHTSSTSQAPGTFCRIVSLRQVEPGPATIQDCAVRRGHDHRRRTAGAADHRRPDIGRPPHQHGIRVGRQLDGPGPSIAGGPLLDNAPQSAAVRDRSRPAANGTGPDQPRPGPGPTLPGPAASRRPCDRCRACLPYRGRRRPGPRGSRRRPAPPRSSSARCSRRSTRPRRATACRRTGGSAAGRPATGNNSNG